MAIAKRVISYLEKNKIKFQIVQHRTVYTAHDVAATLHIKDSEIAKNLLIRAGKDYIVAVLPAHRNVDLKKIATLAGVKKADLPKERVMKTKFKVKPGALSAFGGVYKLPVYVDRALLKQKKVFFSGGSFEQSVQMSPKAFVKLENAIVGVFSVARKKKTKKSKKK